MAGDKMMTYCCWCHRLQHCLFPSKAGKGLVVMTLKHVGFVNDVFVHVIEQDEASTDANHKVDYQGGVAVGALTLVRWGGEGQQPLSLGARR